MKSFEELECWKKASVLRKQLSILVKTFPSEEKYRLCDQIIRASRSVTVNIAEGFGRFHYQENIQFCRQSRGSLYELIDHLIVAREESYISDDTLTNYKKEIHECLAILNGFINYLGRAKSESGSVKEPDEKYSTIEGQLTDNN
jgi:four helix bundle protein